MFIKNLINTTLHSMTEHMRYSGAHVINKENVAEHSYYVTLLADMIAEDILQKNPTISINKLKVLQMALYHDTEEAFTGDLITPVKNKSKELKKEWDKLSFQMMREGLEQDFPEQQHIYKYIISIHEEYEKYKYEDLENQIVKFADGLQSIIYLLREKAYGNTHVLPILTNVISSLQKIFAHNTIFSYYLSSLEEFT